MRSTPSLPLALILFAGLTVAGPRLAAASESIAVNTPQPVGSSHAVGVRPPAASVPAGPSAVQPSTEPRVTPAPQSQMVSASGIETALFPASSGLERGVVPTPVDKAYCPWWAPCSASCPMRCDGGGL